MTPQGYLIVFGPLVLALALLVCSWFVPVPYGGLMRAVSFLIFIVLVVVGLWVMNKMNTDI